ncbi:MAG: hypothetical protein WBA74_24640 [Cyclobacteriaceae bacterium]
MGSEFDTDFIVLIESLGMLMGFLTTIGAIHFLYYIATAKAFVRISVRTFALFFAINAFLFNIGFFSSRWMLFCVCLAACILNGMVLIMYVNQ